MNISRKAQFVLLAVTLIFSTSLYADESKDKAVVDAFYSELLSAATAPDLEQRVQKILADNWITVPASRNGTGAANFAKTLQGFGKIIPDLKWQIEEILQDGNRYIVRGKATGTPVKPFFGVDPSGKSFEIMSIDIHTVENGLITQSYHVEEWHKAIKQLSQ